MVAPKRGAVQAKARTFSPRVGAHSPTGVTTGHVFAYHAKAAKRLPAAFELVRAPDSDPRRALDFQLTLAPSCSAGTEGRPSSKEGTVAPPTATVWSPKAAAATEDETAKQDEMPTQGLSGALKEIATTSGASKVPTSPGPLQASSREPFAPIAGEQQGAQVFTVALYFANDFDTIHNHTEFRLRLCQALARFGLAPRDVLHLSVARGSTVVLLTLRSEVAYNTAVDAVKAGVVIKLVGSPGPFVASFRLGSKWAGPETPSGAEEDKERTSVDSSANGPSGETIKITDVQGQGYTMSVEMIVVCCVAIVLILAIVFGVCFVYKLRRAGPGFNWQPPVAKTGFMSNRGLGLPHSFEGWAPEGCELHGSEPVPGLPRRTPSACSNSSFGAAGQYVKVVPHRASSRSSCRSATPIDRPLPRTPIMVGGYEYESPGVPRFSRIYENESSESEECDAEHCQGDGTTAGDQTADSPVAHAAKPPTPPVYENMASHLLCHSPIENIDRACSPQTRQPAIQPQPVDGSTLATKSRGVVGGRAPQSQAEHQLSGTASCPLKPLRSSTKRQLYEKVANTNVDHDEMPLPERMLEKASKQTVASSSESIPQRESSGESQQVLDNTASTKASPTWGAKCQPTGFDDGYARPQPVYDEPYHEGCRVAKADPCRLHDSAHSTEIDNAGCSSHRERRKTKQSPADVDRTTPKPGRIRRMAMGSRAVEVVLCQPLDTWLDQVPTTGSAP